MKTENMTFSEALEAMKQGYKVKRLVMMRDRIDLKWFPEHFAHYEPKKEVPYMAISGRDYVQCAKFDKDIVFTNKPAKL